MLADVSIWLQRIMKAARETGGGPAMYLRGMFIRVCKLLFFGIRPVFVFDGPAPALKRSTLVRATAAMCARWGRYSLASGGE